MYAPTHNCSRRLVMREAKPEHRPVADRDRYKTRLTPAVSHSHMHAIHVISTDPNLLRGVQQRTVTTTLALASLLFIWTHELSAFPTHSNSPTYRYYTANHDMPSPCMILDSSIMIELSADLQLRLQDITLLSS
eukprot:CAMPEP_0196667178 /NCGR_PEP_ID=MMETSP1086-20130531/64936_1 /TAXON_ID=77921 /ORGANISM="Cyanoptyche  gloeocystis , Strain SAG4.97" /LENGTH=133 /DNA_ID=CAMNT_0042004479 /DNA_START=510 /DNA_END=911 /DNA_ORIENTATION=+